MFACRPSLSRLPHPEPSPSGRGQGEGFLVLLPLLIGAVLRLHGLGAESIWLDEATSILLGQSDIPTLIRTAAQDIHPPLYYLFLHFWLYLGESEFMARALSAFLGVISIAVIYQLGAKLYEERTGLVSALLLAVSPLHIWYSQEARMYVLATLWTMASSFWLWRALRNPADCATIAGELRPWAAYLLCMALGLYTHYYALFVLLFQNCFVAIWWGLSSAETRCDGVHRLMNGLTPAATSPDTLYRRISRHLMAHKSCHISSERKRLARDWLLVQGGLLLLFLPWLPVLLNQVAQGGGGWVAKAIGQPGPRVIVETWIDFSLGNVRQWYPVWIRRAGYALFALALVMTLARPLRQWTRYGRCRAIRWRDILPLLFSGMYCALPLGVVWLISQVKPMYAGRYLLPFLPAYLLLVAAGLRELPWKTWRVAVLGGLVAICLAGAVIAAQRPQKDDWRSAVQYVLQKSAAKDVVVFVPLWNFKPFDYYARGRVALYDKVPVPLAADADIGALLSPALAGHERLWLIWTPGHYADPKGEVQRYLEGHFPRSLAQDFPGVGRISLYQVAGSR